MLLRQETRNIISGLLITIALHLLVIITFLVTKINDVHKKRNEPLVIELDKETYKQLQQMMNEKKPEITQIQPLSGEAIRNIAVNTANQMESKISTEKYIEELKQELNIKELNQQLDRTIKDEEYITTEKREEKPVDSKQKNTFYKGPTRVEYNFSRSHRYIHVPVYKCQGSGRIIIGIIVNPSGEVIDASVVSTSTNEECIIETAIQSARISLFESNLNAGMRDKGTISYEFVAQ